ncbi:MULTISPECIES: hypothetical protein [unclassified Corallococcus]|uniref:hypothetical protein n=1 Tax=unclassified Corallococcus TaxID=2685029 RepID=UPI0011C46709|nr:MULTISPECIES: hypothetical protein [unclassified Corallococcus]
MLTDAELARQRGYRFYVSRKEQRGGRWLKVYEGEMLEEALRVGREAKAFEVAVFLETAHGGFVYWTSKHPDVFNSSVLTTEMS